MKTLLYISLFILLGTSSGPLEEANALFEAKNYAAALTQYRSVLTTYPDQAHEIYFNIGQCYMAMDSVQQALTAYYQALSADHEQTSSLAYNQIGIIFAQGKQYQQALTNFQKAVRMNSLHLEAAYNYELIRRIMEAEQEQNEEPEDQKQESADEQSNDEEGDQQQEEQGEDSDEEADEDREEEEQEKEPQDATHNNEAQQPANNDQALPFSTDTLDMARARQLLDRMRENEMRFMQELRKKTKKQEKTGKPDW